MRQSHYAAAPWRASRSLRNAGRLGLLLISLLVLASVAANQAPIPTISVIAVAEDDEVTIRTANFPAERTFYVTMGPMGTRGVSGYLVGTIESGAGGTIEATFAIPEELHGSRQIAIRAQTDHVNPYYSYNWFFNKPSVTAPTPPDGGAGEGDGPAAPAYSGTPTVSISSVEVGTSVTVVTNNFPAGQTFNVIMGPRGSRGVGGTIVGTLDSGDGGSVTATYAIPEGLQDAYIVAIRLQTEHSNPYYSYNWFYNNTAAADAGTPAATPPAEAGTGGQPAVGAPAGSGAAFPIPTIAVCAVTKDDTVTIRTANFPAGQTFVITMGAMWTRGVGGTVVGNLNSGDGGALEASYPIPDALVGTERIAIRAQTSHVNPYYSYGWFYNANAAGCD